MAELYHLVILPASQGRGIGRATVEQLSRGLAAQGFHTLMVAHHPDAQGAHAFYHRLGFLPAGRNHDDDPWLALKLRPDHEDG